MSRYTSVTRDPNVMSRFAGFFYNVMGAAVAANDSIQDNNCSPSNVGG